MCFPARKNITRLPNVELAVGQIGDFINTSISHVVIWLARDAQRKLDTPIYPEKYTSEMHKISKVMADDYSLNLPSNCGRLNAIIPHPASLVRPAPGLKEAV